MADELGTAESDNRAACESERERVLMCGLRGGSRAEATLAPMSSHGFCWDDPTQPPQLQVNFVEFCCVQIFEPDEIGATVQVEIAKSRRREAENADAAGLQGLVVSGNVFVEGTTRVVRLVEANDMVSAQEISKNIGQAMQNRCIIDATSMQH